MDFWGERSSVAGWIRMGYNQDREDFYIYV